MYKDVAKLRAARADEVSQPLTFCLLEVATLSSE